MRRAGELYKFPWTPRAEKYALDLATPINLANGRVVPPVPYRAIAADMFARGLVPALPDAATVRRKVLELRAAAEGRAEG